VRDPRTLQNIDRNLVERFRKGDNDAFHELYERMCPRIHRFAMRLAGCREDAEDITVQTFAEAYRSKANFLERSSVETWLYRIAVHQAHRLHRKRRPESALHESLVDEAGSEGFERIVLEQLIADLPERQRLAFLLVKSEGLTYREASEVLGRPMGTIQSDVHEAAKRLRKLFVPESAETEKKENYGYEV
jgi:RNA polymerase sigma-70 factor (ECF subfamily)